MKVDEGLQARAMSDLSKAVDSAYKKAIGDVINKPISVEDVINNIIKLGDTPIICKYASCNICNFDSFCDAFFKCYKVAIKYKKED